MFGRRLINTGGISCTTDTLQILGDTSCVATYRLNGDATDLSGNYNGTATSVTYVAGIFGDAGSFNGSSSYVALPNSVSGIGAFTLSAWVNFNNITTAQGIWSLGSLVSGNIYSELFVENGIVYFRVGGSTNYFFATSTAGDISTDIWKNIVCVFPNTTETNGCKIYIDDIEAAAVTSSVGSINRNTTFNTIGARGTGGTQSIYFNGDIDQVRIFNRAITAAEVTTLYNEVAC